ncbi:hypothetical protein HK104_006336 [Borealophlyctis nickersoniae]|nr:hypothetical protein HK104_006336 [Borealophlyctis nickersoniae]
MSSGADACAVKVAIRVRPLNEREQASTHTDAWTIQGNTIFLPDLSDNKPLPGTVYTFDKIFAGNVQTSDIYAAVGKDLVAACLDGVNGGNSTAYVVFLEKLIQSSPFRYNICVWANLYGFIFAKHRLSVVIAIDRNAKRGVAVHDLTEKIVGSYADVEQAMRIGEGNRHVGETNMNEKSSRSHTILRMVIESREKSSHNPSQARSSLSGAVRVSTLNLVDLAGSERVGHTGAEGIRLKEGGHINKSLLTLGTVISKLSDGGDRVHIPYRDSKLTRILQPSLGGNARTAIICTVTPARMHVDVTMSTLKFASRAKTITNKPEVNEVISDEAMLKNYKRQISELKKQLDEMSKQEESLANQKLQAEEANEMNKLRLQETKETEARLKKQLDVLSKIILNSSVTTVARPTARKNRARRQTWFAGVSGPPEMEDEVARPLSALSGNFGDKDMSPTRKRTLPEGVFNTGYEKNGQPVKQVLVGYPQFKTRMAKANGQRKGLVLFEKSWTRLTRHCIKTTKPRVGPHMDNIMSMIKALSYKDRVPHLPDDAPPEVQQLRDYINELNEKVSQARYTISQSRAKRLENEDYLQTELDTMAEQYEEEKNRRQLVIQSYEQQLSKLEAELSQTKASLQEAQDCEEHARIKAQRENLGDAEAAVSDANATEAEKIAALESNIRDITHENSCLQRKVAELSQLEKDVAGVKAQAARTSELEKELEAVRSKNEAYHETFSSLHESEEKQRIMEEENAKLRERLVAYTKAELSRDQLQEEVKKKAELLQERESRIVALEEELLGAQEQLQTKEHHLSAAKTSLNDKEKEISEMLSRHPSEKTVLEEQSLDARNGLGATDLAGVNSTSSAGGMLEELLEKHEEVMALKMQLGELEAKLTAKEAALQEVVDDPAERSSAHSREVLALREQLDEGNRLWTVHREETSKETAALRTQLTEAISERTLIRNEYDEYVRITEQEKAELGRKFADLSVLQDALNEATAEIKKLRGVQQEAQKLSEQSSLLQSKLDNATAEAELVRMAREKEAQTAISYKAEIEHLRADFTEERQAIENRILALSSKHSNELETLSAAKDHLESMCEEIRAREQTVSEKMSLLAEQLHTSEQKLLSAQAQIQTLSAKEEKSRIMADTAHRALLEQEDVFARLTNEKEQLIHELASERTRVANFESIMEKYQALQKEHASRTADIEVANSRIRELKHAASQLEEEVELQKQQITDYEGQLSQAGKKGEEVAMLMQKLDQANEHARSAVERNRILEIELANATQSSEEETEAMKIRYEHLACERDMLKKSLEELGATQQQSQAEIERLLTEIADLKNSVETAQRVKEDLLRSLNQDLEKERIAKESLLLQLDEARGAADGARTNMRDLEERHANDILEKDQIIASHVATLQQKDDKRDEELREWALLAMKKSQEKDAKIQDLQCEVEDLRTSWTTLSARHDTVCQEKKALSSDLDNLDRELARLKEVIADLQQKEAETEAARLAAHDENATEKHELRSNMEGQALENQRLAEECNEAKAKLREKISDLLKHKIKLEHSLAESQREAAELKRIQETFTKKMEESDAGGRSAAAEMERLKTENAALSAQMQEARECRDQLEERQKALGQTVQELKKQVHTLSQQMKEIEAHRIEQEAEFEESKNNLDCTILGLQSQLRSALGEVEAKNRDNAVLLEVSQRMQAGTAVSNEDIANLRAAGAAETSKLQAEAQEAQRREANLVRELKNQKRHSQQLLQDMARLKDINADLSKS